MIKNFKLTDKVVGEIIEGPKDAVLEEVHERLHSYRANNPLGHTYILDSVDANQVEIKQIN